MDFDWILDFFPPVLIKTFTVWMGQEVFLVIINPGDIGIITFHPLQVGFREKTVITRSVTDISHAVD